MFKYDCNHKLMIPEQFLRANFTVKTYVENQLIFREGQRARFFYQIKKGAVEMFNLSESGKKFVQSRFNSGQSFGEPPLFGDFRYPANAETIATSEIYKIEKNTLFNFLDHHPKIYTKIIATLSKRMRYKAMILKETCMFPPEHRIFTLLNYLKKVDGNPKLYKIELTRQEIAELTGLRVETVIKSIKNLEKQQKVLIDHRKVYI